MHDTGMRPTRRFTLDEDRAHIWLRHAVAAHVAYINGDQPPAGLEGFSPSGNLPEIDDDWDPRAPGSEVDVYDVVRDAVDAGIIGTPVDETVHGRTEKWDLEFIYSDDSDGGGYYFIVRLGLDLKLATLFEEMRRLGERDATGVAAALAILTEAVTLANATLDALDAFVAARAQEPFEGPAAAALRRGAGALHEGGISWTPA